MARSVTGKGGKAACQSTQPPPLVHPGVTRRFEAMSGRRSGGESPMHKPVDSGTAVQESGKPADPAIASYDDQYRHSTLPKLEISYSERQESSLYREGKTPVGETGGALCVRKGSERVSDRGQGLAAESLLCRYGRSREVL